MNLLALSDAVQLSVIAGVVALATGITSITAAVVTAFMARAAEDRKAEQAREDKQQEWARQDEVARQATEAAKTVAAAAEAVKVQAAEAAKLLAEQNKYVTESATSTNQQLKAIHSLVNSNLTVQMRRELVALKGQRVLLKRAIERDGQSEDTAVMADLEKQICELEMSLADRDRHSLADAQAGQGN